VSTASVATSYRALFAEPVLRRLAVADAFARLPQGMVSITVLLVAAEHASMAVAGLAVAGYTLGQAVTGPVRGRLADRHGLVPVAAACGTGYALALLTLLAGAMAGAPAGLLIGTAAAAGLVNPPLSPGLRSLWSVHAGAGLAPTAFALDAAVMNLGYIAGPVLAAALAAGLAPAAALGLLLALTGAATVIIGRQPRRSPATVAVRQSLVPSPGLRRLMLTAALVNAALSASEVALTGYVRHHHALWASARCWPRSRSAASLAAFSSVPVPGPAPAPCWPATRAGWPCSPRPASTPRCSPWPPRWPDSAWDRPWPFCSARRRTPPLPAAAPRPRPGSTRS